MPKRVFTIKTTSWGSKSGGLFVLWRDEGQRGVTVGQRTEQQRQRQERTGEQQWTCCVDQCRAGLWTGRSERAGQSAGRARRTPRTLLHFHLDPLFVLSSSSSSSRLLVFRHSLSPSLFCQLQPRYTAKHLRNEDNEKTVADTGLYGSGVFLHSPPPPLQQLFDRGSGGYGSCGVPFMGNGVLPRNIVNIKVAKTAF